MILSIGGCGFIGNALTRQLAALDEEVVCADLVPDHDLEGPNVTVTELDITDYDKIIALIEEHEPEQVVHLAYAYPKMNEGMLDAPTKEVTVNCLGMDNVLRAAEEGGVDRLVYASSSVVYGLMEAHTSPVTEDSPPRAAYTEYPLLMYAATKQFNEYQARVYGDNHDMTVAGVRPSFVFGTGLDVWRSTFITDPAKGDTGSIPFRPDRNLTMVDVNDVADLIKRVLTADKVAHHAYNTGGHTLPARELAAISSEITGGTVNCDENADQPELAYNLSHRRAKDEFGYELTPLEASIREHVEQVS